ncbi:Zinc phosphodiesterase ELAC protein 2 [Bagarius yarrelli]|uniref:ribonuclease Z n=1 Tax=Bagarius yarrelli TaxID=175774 RepID=A0A556V7C5_BAGYA|nr:Zinc phosphodiesterase ELAC protein 2 [Bagarius yarrelli]
MEAVLNRKPKPPKDTLRHVRSKESRKHADLHGPSNVYVQVVGAGARDNSASLYVFSEYNRAAVRPYTEPEYRDDTMTQKELCQKESEERRSDGSESPEPRERSTRDPSLVVAYVCKLHPKKGNFLVHKAKELGLPVGTAAIGPLISALKAGKSVTYEGKEVKSCMHAIIRCAIVVQLLHCVCVFQIQPDEVCTPADPGPVFLVIDCPSEEFVQSLCTNQVLARYQSAGSERSAALVVHVTPEEVLKTLEYQHWMERFSSSTEHLIMNEQVFTIHQVRSHKIQTQLHLIHSEIFPELQRYISTESQAALHVPNVRAECLLKFQLRPKAEWQRDAILTCDREEFIKEAAEVPNFLQEVDECKNFQDNDSAILSGMNMNAEFIMLTHFSQRYAKIPLFSSDVTRRVGVAFDHMRIRFGDFRILPRLLAPLKALFAEEIEEMEERRGRRELRAGKGVGAEPNGQPGEGGGAKRENEESDHETTSKRMKAN